MADNDFLNQAREAALQYSDNDLNRFVDKDSVHTSKLLKSSLLLSIIPGALMAWLYGISYVESFFPAWSVIFPCAMIFFLSAWFSVVIIIILLGKKFPDSNDGLTYGVASKALKLKDEWRAQERWSKRASLS